MSGESAENAPREPKVLVVGGGAREHALVRALRRAGAEVVCAPGNPGIARTGGTRVVPVAPDDLHGLVRLATAESVDLVVVGPEKPLTAGLADALRAAGVATFGPGAKAAALEGSKAFMKSFLARHAIPTAAFRVFDDPTEALAYVRAEARPVVVKADGLAAGKGVVVASDALEAEAAVRAMMIDRVFGDAGARVVVEDVLPGEEASFHVLVAVDAASGHAGAVPLVAAQDHKRALDGDRGPNTGGMGAYAPAPIVTPEVHSKVMERIVAPTVRGLLAEGLDFRGVLFVGLMIERGEPRVLEFNVRFGDPEATVILPPLGDRAYALLRAAADGTLPDASLELAGDSAAALTVVLASEGYPASPTIGDPIDGLDAAAAYPHAFVHHAGTRAVGESIVTAGGRVLGVTGEGPTLAVARDRAYAAAAAIQFRGMHLRRDIGHRALG